MSDIPLRFPIGIFNTPPEITDAILLNWQADISTFPYRLRIEVQTLSDGQLDTPYRPGGWTIRQVVHHCADSHVNSYIRFKQALTEENTIIKPYFEDRWAELSDSTTLSVESSFLILEGIYTRWTALIQTLTKTDLQHTFYHPEHLKSYHLAEVLGYYAWHGNHHLAHIISLKNNKGWS
jgi:hypothetical protein